MPVRCSAISRKLQARRRSTNAEATTRGPVRVLMSAVDYGEADGSWQGANPARAFGMVHMDLNLKRIRRACLQGLMPASERIIMGRMSAGWERFLSGEPKSSSWAFTSLVCSTRLDARLGAVFDERSRV
jgi:hypothetical protein